MRLSRLLAGIGYNGGFSDAEITGVVADSRKVEKGSLFVAVKGKNYDGHGAVRQAFEKGAAAVVCERGTGAPNEIIVEDSRKAGALLASEFFGNPGKKLKLIAVTGTNGKTTVSGIIKQALEFLGFSAGLIGTVQCEIGKEIIPAKYTTPEPWELSALLARMADAGCAYAVLEASSQALAQHRLYGQSFETAVFTNLTQDHLDYHGSMEEYYAAKRALFDMSVKAVVNFDDAYGRRLLEEIGVPALSFSVESSSADYTAKNIEYAVDGVRFVLSSDSVIERVKLPVPGRYAVSNALAAVCALLSIGFSPAEAARAVSSVKGVRGRCEVLRKGGFTVISDFAHTADALEQLLSSMKPYTAGKMIVVFGCAGERDGGKREDMTRTVCEYADAVIATADNPRGEDLSAILGAMETVLKAEKAEYIIEPDREKAVLAALGMCREGDLLLLCGKGHEDYQVMDGYTVYLDERETVNTFFSRKGNVCGQ